jgi:hypothetical protein
MSQTYDPIPPSHKKSELPVESSCQFKPKTLTSPILLMQSIVGTPTRLSPETALLSTPGNTSIDPEKRPFQPPHAAHPQGYHQKRPF